MIKKYTDDIAKRYGKMTNVEKSINGDLVYCKINQLDEKGGFLKNGISNDATVSMDHIDAKMKKRFIGVKNGDNLKIDIFLGLVYLIKYSRFGMVSKYKWSFKKNDWISR